MPAEVLSDIQHKGLLDPRGLVEKEGNVNCPSRGKSGWGGNRSFFLGGEKGER